MSKIDFERLVPEPPPPPSTPPCVAEYTRYTGGGHSERSPCGAKSHYRIGGKHYCKRHVYRAAFAYLDSLEEHEK